MVIKVITGYGRVHPLCLTLAWLMTFGANWNEIESLGFDQRFKRMWEYYLHYCAAGFMEGRLDVKQIGLIRT